MLLSKTHFKAFTHSDLTGLLDRLFSYSDFAAYVLTGRIYGNKEPQLGL